MKILAAIATGLLSLTTFYSVINEKEQVVEVLQHTPPDCGEHPTNVNWAELRAHYDSCTIYTTRREGARSMSEFIRYIQHEDAATKTVKEVECRMTQTYYRRLKRCSQCHTTDCLECDRLMETLQDARQLVREKRFSLE